jgi:polysaccharide pyruvyl transferase CsaB
LIWRELEKTDIAVGSGGLLQEATSRRSLLYYLAIIRMAKLRGVPVFLIGQGIGPFRGEFGKKLTKRVLQKVEYISVRDKKSLELLKSWGLQASLMSDPAFSLKAKQPKLDEIFDDKKNKMELLGVSLVPQVNTNLASLLDEATRELKMKVVFLPAHPKDLVIAEEVSRQMKERSIVLNTSHLSVSEVMHLIGGFSLILGARLHVLEFATMAGVPFVALSYDPKIAAFTTTLEEMTGLTVPCLDIGEINKKVVSHLKRLKAERELYKKAFLKSALKLSKSAEEGLEEVCQRINDLIRK